MDSPFTDEGDDTVPRIQEDIRPVAVDSLVLDLKNFRFGVDLATEQEAFNYLFEEWDGMGMARTLLRAGYLTNDLPLVVEENGHHVVLEANRRVSALRALKNPSLVPAYRKQLEAEVRRYQVDADELPDQVMVSVFPDRKTAAQVLARQHIGQDKKRWGLDEQAKFVMAQLADGTTVQELKERLPGIEDIPRLIRMSHVRDVLKKTTFTDPDIAVYAASPALKMSVFEYAYRDRNIQPLLGFAFTKYGDVTARPTTPQEIAVLERVLSGFKHKELSTRKVLPNKKSAEYCKLLDELCQIHDNQLPSAEGRSDPSQTVPGDIHRSSPSGRSSPDAGQASARPSPSGNEPHLRGPNDPGTLDHLDTAGLDLKNATESFKSRIVELRSLKLSTQSTAAAVLLRCIVEAAIKEHFAQRRRHLNGMLGKVTDELFKQYGKDKTISAPIGLLKGARGEIPGSIGWFNGPAHSMHFTIRPREVHEAWRELLPLLRFLVEPVS